MANGFDNDVMFASNVDFRGTSPIAAQVVSNGQLLIGSSIAPNIRVNNLTSSDNSITITNGNGTIDLSTITADANFVRFTTPITGIDYTTTGTTILYTVPAGKQFYITTFIMFTTSVVNFTVPGSLNVGVTPAAYNDYLGDIPVDTTLSNKFNNIPTSGGAGNQPIATAGTDIIMNITVGVTADTYIGGAYIIGVQF